MSDVLEADILGDEDRREARVYRFHMQVVPPLRAVGCLILALLVLLHNRYVSHDFEPARFAKLVVFLTVYVVVSWLALRWWFQPLLPRLNLGTVFLIADVGVWLVAIYCSGAENSWLFFVLLARVGDQANTSFRRVVLFAHLVVVGYLLMVAYAVLVDAHPVVWSRELAKALALYGCGLYLSFTARAAERLRARTERAVATSRRLIVELEEKNRRLQEVSRVKSEFLATVSHELKTPLNAILGFSQLLADMTFGELNAKQLKYVENTLAGARALLQHIERILEFSELEAGRALLRSEPVKVESLAARVVERLKPAADAKGVTLEMECAPGLPRVQGDPVRLERVLQGLLENAVKFSPRGTAVKLKLEDGDRTLKICVVDEGDGVAPEDHQRVFQPFVQADSSYGRTHQGFGLGLATIRHLVALHQGRVWVESSGKGGEGAAFHVELPGFRPGSDQGI